MKYAIITIFTPIGTFTSTEIDDVSKENIKYLVNNASEGANFRFKDNKGDDVFFGTELLKNSVIKLKIVE